MDYQKVVTDCLPFENVCAFFPRKIDIKILGIFNVGGNGNSLRPIKVYIFLNLVCLHVDLMGKLLGQF